VEQKEFRLPTFEEEKEIPRIVTRKNREKGSIKGAACVPFSSCTGKKKKFRHEREVKGILVLSERGEAGTLVPIDKNEKGEKRSRDASSRKVAKNPPDRTRRSGKKKETDLSSR